MDRTKLIDALNFYKTSFKEERPYIPRFLSLLINFENCYKRSLKTGHITASAWIINESGSSALLLHHKKLNRWLQPGGHADGDENIISVSRKEAIEETGITKLKLFNENIFDIDIHLIPGHKEISSHYHYDIRFLFIADNSENFILSEESNDIAWISLKNINEYVNGNSSINRMILKTKLIFK